MSAVHRWTTNMGKRKSRKQDERDAAIAHKRLAEIEAHPERMVAGERLDQWLAKVEEEDAKVEEEDNG